MVTFLTSDPLYEDGTISVLNEANGFVDVLGQYWDGALKCLFIASDPDDYESNDENQLRYGGAIIASGLEVECFDLLDHRTVDMPAEQILDYDMIMLCGGHVPTERSWFEEIELRKHLEHFDGIVIGISAGSMNSAEEVFALPELEGETEDPEYDWFFQGLGFAKTSIIPHFQAIYDQELDGKELIDDIAFSYSHGKNFLGLPDGSFVVIENGMELVFGESYLIADGQITPFSGQDECREYMNYGPYKKDVTVIGASIIDVLVGPVTPDVFKTGSQPVEMSKLSFGGDALNEAVVLSRFGKKTELVTKLGEDENGARVYEYIQKNKLSTESVTVEQGLATAMNVVLVDDKGERHFLTNPNSNLRRLAVEDIDEFINTAADIVSFASMFVSPMLGIDDMNYLFQRIKSRPNRTLVVDMTKAKNGETLEDIKELLPYIDYILPNEDEIALLTGIDDVYENARLLVESGVKCAVIKRGGKGCLIRTKDKQYEIPAYHVKNVVDSTGAGDCFAAGFLWALSEGLSLKDCGRFANVVASCSVEQMGATDGVHSLKEPMRRMWRKWHWSRR